MKWINLFERHSFSELTEETDNLNRLICLGDEVMLMTFKEKSSSWPHL